MKADMNFTVQRDDESAPFFDAAAAGRLVLRRCPTCAMSFGPQQRRCTDGTLLEWFDAAGRGTLVSWIIDHSPGLHPALTGPDGTTSVAAMIELSEGPWLNAALVDIDPAMLRAGDEMTVRFVPLGDESETIPVFTRA